MTPWFTAGAGIVIAAMLAVDLPHTVLSYGPYQSPCHQNCLNPEPSKGKGTLANAGPGLRITTRQPAERSTRGQDAHQAGQADPSALKVGYRIVRQWDSGFLAAITLPSGVAESWKLQLSFRSAQIQWVWGADWRPSGDGSSGIISAGGNAFHGGGSPAGQGGGQGAASQARSAEDQMSHWALGNTHSHSVEFVVFAIGAPQTPTGCSLSGKPCTFG